MTVIDPNVARVKVIDDFYIPSVNLVSDGKLPIIRVKIKTKGDILIPKIFNNYGKKISPEQWSIELPVTEE